MCHFIWEKRKSVKVRIRSWSDKPPETKLPGETEFKEVIILLIFMSYNVFLLE